MQYIKMLTSNGRACTGSITMLTNGSRKVGLTCFGGAGWAGHMVGWTAADATLAGTAAYEYRGDLDFNDISIPLSSVDCETVTFP